MKQIKKIFIGESRITYQVPFFMLPKKRNAANSDHEFFFFGMVICNSCKVVNLFHPLDCHPQMELPDFINFRKNYQKGSHNTRVSNQMIRKFGLSSSSSLIIMVHYNRKDLTFGRPRENEYWTSIGREKSKTISELIYYKGEVYTVGENDDIFVYDIEEPKVVKKRDVA